MLRKQRIRSSIGQKNKKKRQSLKLAGMQIVSLVKNIGGVVYPKHLDFDPALWVQLFTATRLYR